MSLRELFTSAREKYQAKIKGGSALLEEIEAAITANLSEGEVTVRYDNGISPDNNPHIVSNLRAAGFDVEISYKGKRSFLHISWR